MSPVPGEQFVSHTDCLRAPGLSGTMAVECYHSQPFLRLQLRQGSTETPKTRWMSGMSVGMVSGPTSSPWHGLGVRLHGEVGAEVLVAKQSASNTEMRAGLWLLGSVSDRSRSSFSWTWGCWCQPVPETTCAGEGSQMRAEGSQVQAAQFPPDQDTLVSGQSRAAVCQCGRRKQKPVTPSGASGHVHPQPGLSRSSLS